MLADHALFALFLAITVLLTGGSRYVRLKRREGSAVIALTKQPQHQLIRIFESVATQPNSNSHPEAPAHETPELLTPGTVTTNNSLFVELSSSHKIFAY